MTSKSERVLRPTLVVVHGYAPWGGDDNIPSEQLASIISGELKARVEGCSLSYQRELVPCSGN